MCSWWPRDIFPLMGLLKENRMTCKDMEVQKRVRMGWPAKGWISNMLVHSCGLQKAWCVKLWSAQRLVGQSMAWARPNAESQATCQMGQTTMATCKNNSCVAFSLGIPVTDRLLYKFASGDPLLQQPAFDSPYSWY
jgi:hypothetical protein